MKIQSVFLSVASTAEYNLLDVRVCVHVLITTKYHPETSPPGPHSCALEAALKREREQDWKRLIPCETNLPVAAESRCTHLVNRLSVCAAAADSDLLAWKQTQKTHVSRLCRIAAFL